jgi:hypothetical protein
MKSDLAILPSVSRLATSLHKITERLASELETSLAETPEWGEFEWRIARAVAAMHGISPVLDTHLRWQGPQGWRKFLEEQHHQSVKRHLLIEGLLREIDHQARRANVGFVALKGAALHAIGLYAPGERPMGDIDLLVRPDDIASVAEVLGHCGYEVAFDSQRHLSFQPTGRQAPTVIRLGEHIDNPVKVELHSKIAEQLPVTEVDVTAFLLPSPMESGLNAYPSMSSLMMHLLLHAAGNMRAHALRALQLHDIALLAKRFTAEDWEQLLSMAADDDRLWWAFGPMVLTSRYYSSAIPTEVISRLKAGCPWLLHVTTRHQQLTTVSWSNIRIAAFPGILWSRSGSEALEFMRRRIWPSREARSELREGAAQIPQSSSVPWYGISHGARIMVWLFSRPPRVQTLLSVRAALASDA